MPRYFELISREDLAKKILDAAEARMASGEADLQYEDYEVESPTSGNRIKFIHDNAHMLELYELTSQVVKDQKVRFGSENLEASPDECYGMAESICGIRTLPNGLTYLGITAGGDWETPLFFIIYWDGKKLRSYVPTDGNPWNVINKIAYGNDENQIHPVRKDAADKAKRFPGQDPHDINIECDKVTADIAARILPRSA